MQGPGDPGPEGVALDEERLVLEVRTVVVSYVAALRRLSFVERDRAAWVDHARQHAQGLIDKIQDRASKSAVLTEAHQATIADGREMIDAAAASALERTPSEEE